MGVNVMKVDLSSKTAVITGAGGVLCRMFACEIAKAGAKVAALDMNGEAAKETASIITKAGGVAIAVECNVLDHDSVINAEKIVYSALGEYNLLINGAGGNDARTAVTTNEQYRQEDVDDSKVVSFFDILPKAFSKIIDLNLLGTFIPTQVFVKRMVNTKSPAIINISSMTSFVPLTKALPYGNAKAAVNNLTQWMAVHFGNVGVRVNAIAPGFFITAQNRAMMVNDDGSLTERSKKIIEHTPLARLGNAEDLVGPLLFLCDETASGFVSGVVLPVDGGFMAMPCV